MQSEAVFLILSNLTGLSLHALAVNRNSDVSDCGSYTELAPRTSKNGQRDQKLTQSKYKGGIEINSSSGSEGEEDKKVKPKRKRRRLNSKSSEGEKSADSSKEAEVDDNNQSGKCLLCKFCTFC